MKVSIIIPVYNVAPYIADCLRSVMRQTYTGTMECLIVDDCGTDDSIAIAERMIADYKGPIRFQILHHEQNRGLSAARNTGTEAAIGEYLYYMDSDDEITEDCIERLMGKVAEYPDVEMVQGNACRHLMGGGSVNMVKEVLVSSVESNEEARRCFYQYRQIYVNVWNKLLRRDFVVNNRILCKEGLLYEDNLWVFYLLRYLEKAAFVSDITYHYKKRPKSITTGTDFKTEGLSWCVIYRDILNDLTPGYEQEEFYYYRKGIGHDYLRYVRDVPEFEEIFRLCKEKCKVYGSRSLQLRLAVCSALGPLKYGWEIWKLMGWLIHPVKKIKAKLNAARR